MRISDWGSDVCSSDLIQVADQLRRLARRVAVAGEAVGAQAPAQLQRAAGVVVEFAADLPVPGRQRPRRVRVGERVERVADDEHRAGQRAQTGRESSRERWGQAVSISGGGESEKKTKTNNVK